MPHVLLVGVSDYHGWDPTCGHRWVSGTEQSLENGMIDYWKSNIIIYVDASKRPVYQVRDTVKFKRALSRHKFNIENGKMVKSHVQRSKLGPSGESLENICKYSCSDR